MKKHFLVKANVILKRDDDQVPGQLELTFTVPARTFRYQNEDLLKEKLEECAKQMAVHQLRYEHEDVSLADKLVADMSKVTIADLTYNKVQEYDELVPLSDLTKGNRPSWITKHEIEYDNKVANIVQLMRTSTLYRSLVSTLSCAIEKGPLFDGEVPSKSDRDFLMDLGLMCKVVQHGEDGQNAATHLGRDVYTQYWEGDSLRDATQNRQLRWSSHCVELLRCDTIQQQVYNGEQIQIVYPSDVIKKMIDNLKRDVHGILIKNAVEYAQIRGNSMIPLEILSHEFSDLFIDSGGVLRGNVKFSNYCRSDELKRLLKKRQSVRFVPRGVITLNPPPDEINGVYRVTSYNLVSIDAILDGNWNAPSHLSY